ncbi:MAG TPA: DUF721 domain-containing protein [Candidatus Anoxymicrobiaceae bacterium]
MPEPESLGSIIARGKVPGPKKRKHRLELLAVNWEHIVGDRMAAHSAPTRLTRGTLTVAADSPAWAAELSMATQSLLVRIRAIMGDDIVKKVRVQSRAKGSAAEAAAARGEGTGRPEKNVEIGGRIGDDLGALEDEEVRAALERLVRASKSSRYGDRDSE